MTGIIEQLLLVIDCRINVMSLYRSLATLNAAPDYGDIVNGIRTLIQRFDKAINHPFLAGVNDNIM